MREVVRALPETLWLVSCVVLASCAASSSDDEADPDLDLVQELPIKFSPMYSAYDGDHSFQVTPVLALNKEDAEDTAIIASTVHWTVDRFFLQREDAEPDSVLLTTRRSGKTKIRVTAMTQSGAKKTGEAFLYISHATRDEWEAGAAYYSQTGGIREPILRGFCGLSAERATELVELAPGCARCHAEGSSFARPPTPAQTAGLDDDQLLQVFSEAAALPSGMSSSPLLQRVPEPDCVLRAFHTWELTESEKRGLVWQLRAIPPATYPEPDAAEAP